MGRYMVIVGTLLVAAGLVAMGLGRLGIGRLPGDLVIRRGGFVLYLPLSTSILLSILLSVALWLWSAASRR